MRKREVVEYVAYDGKVFDNEFECKEYEKHNNFREFAERRLKEVASKMNDILKDNDAHLEIRVAEGRILICLNEHFEDLGVPL